MLTKPHVPAGNNGFDNDASDLILCVNDVLHSENEFPVRRFRVIDLVGQGTFGQVVRCEDLTTHATVAIKVIKNRPAYYNQAFMEIRILKLLNDQCDPNDDHHIVRLLDNFMFKNHLCLAFEVLSMTLYDVIKLQNHRGVAIAMIRVFVSQLLETLTLLRHHRIIHCDLKPENILLRHGNSSTIKVIDFGSACFEFQTVYSYIQSRFYRAPEILLGLPYQSAIDIWSLGCIAAELFLGLPLFPGSDEQDQVRRIVEVCGAPPPAMLRSGAHSPRYFADDMELHPAIKKATEGATRYFPGVSLEDIVRSHERPREDDDDDTTLDCFIDFLSGMLRIDPHMRWTPAQAAGHPFVTGAAYSGPYIPSRPGTHSFPMRSAPQRIVTPHAQWTHNRAEGHQHPPIYSYAGHRVGGGCVGSASGVADRRHVTDFLLASSVSKTPAYMPGRPPLQQQYPMQPHQQFPQLSAGFAQMALSAGGGMARRHSSSAVPTNYVRLSAAPGRAGIHRHNNGNPTSNSRSHNNNNNGNPTSNNRSRASSVASTTASWQPPQPSPSFHSPLISPGAASMADWDPFFNADLSGGSTPVDGSGCYISNGSKTIAPPPTRQRRSSMPSPNPGPRKPSVPYSNPWI
ncbi:hypothetical protein PBRA_005663 [Plasmodiophora brassicae]|nr:hypothetical protein PBRA_005663 [Plasmodiophora brassicae]